MPQAITILISKLFIKSILVFQLIFSFLIFTEKLGENISKYSGNNNISVYDTVYLSLLYSPSIVLVITPFVFLFASFYTIRKLALSQELIVIKSLGVSIWKILKPLSIITISWGVIVVFIFYPLSSMFLDKYRILQSKNHDNSPSINYPIAGNNIWLISHISATEKYIIFANSLTKKNNNIIFMNNISILFMDNNILKQMIEAKTGLVQNNILTIENATIKQINQSLPYKFDKLDINIQLEQKEFLSLLSSPDRVEIWKMPSIIANLNLVNLDSYVYQVYFYNTLTIPILLLIMLFLSVAFATANNRKKGELLNIIYMILCGFLLFIFINIFNTFGNNGVLYPIIAVLIAKILALLFAITLLIYKEGL